MDPNVRKKIIFDINIPRVFAYRFSANLVSIVFVIGGLFIFPAIELVGQVTTERPIQTTPSPLENAKQLTGILHFTDGARNWRASKLRLADGTVLPLECKKYLARNACFTLSQGEQYEAMQARVWLDSTSGVLQLDIAGERVIQYEDTLRRFAMPDTNEVPKFLMGYFAALAALFLLGCGVTKISLVNTP